MGMWVRGRVIFVRLCVGRVTLPVRNVRHVIVLRRICSIILVLVPAHLCMGLLILMVTVFHVGVDFPIVLHAIDKEIVSAAIRVRYY